MSSLRKMLSVLDLFKDDKPSMSADEIGAALGLARTTCYRYVRELAHAGLLVSSGGRYFLGHRIIQLDHQIRTSDPLINAARPLMKRWVQETGAVVLLTSIYASEIVNIHVESGEDMPSQLLGRGRAMPLFRTATSRAILAALPRARLKRLHAAQQGVELESWTELNRSLNALRQQGYGVSHGEMAGALDGISAPIVGAPRDVPPAAISLVFRPERYRMFDERHLGLELAAGGRAIGEALSLPEFTRA
jgi:DNA-binding IclR family transcriptional regulator